jgi:hypothetical protein
VGRGHSPRLERAIASVEGAPAAVLKCRTDRTWGSATAGFAGAAAILVIVWAVSVRDAVPAMRVVFGSAMLGAVTLCGWMALISFGLARRGAEVCVGASHVVIDNPALFVKPLVVDRSQVHSIWLLDDYQRPLVGSASLPKPWYSPDVGATFGPWNFLLVLNPPIALGGYVRRGVGLLRVLLGRAGGHRGPTRWSVARGFFAAVVDIGAARDAIVGWPTGTESPWV